MPNGDYHPPHEPNPEVGKFLRWLGYGIAVFAAVAVHFVAPRGAAIAIDILLFSMCVIPTK